MLPVARLLLLRALPTQACTFCFIFTCIDWHAVALHVNAPTPTARKETGSGKCSHEFVNLAEALEMLPVAHLPMDMMGRRQAYTYCKHMHVLIVMQLH